jgi:4-amino-4-deoxy-L-arabinose transferase-like glycosyltransferase
VWYFVPILAVGLLPWTLALPQALRLALPRREGGFNTERFLAVWCAVTFVFFSASHSKLESYILPLYPALAMLLARALLEMPQSAFKWRVTPIAVLGLVIACGAPIALWMARSSVPLDLRLRYIPWLVGAGLLLALTAYGARRASELGARLGAIALLAFGGLGAAQLALAGHESLAPVYSSYHIALEAQPYLSAETPFFAVDDYDHTLPFYTRHTMTMVAYRDEYSAGIAAEPQKFIPTLDQFEAVWRAAPHAVAFMKPDLYDAFLREGLPMKLIARDSRRVLVAKP